MIQLKDIRVIFNQATALEQIALRNINLTISEGDFITVIGGNGAGKSTLMSVLAGELTPNSGIIICNNENITKQSVVKRAKFIGRVFQDPCSGTCEALTIEENLAFAAHGGSKRTLQLALTTSKRKQFRDMLADLNLGLENRLNDQVGLLSGGQRQALSLVMATLRAPKILLLDEHTAALDHKTADIILHLTHSIITRYRLTTIMITHNLQQALAMGNRTILMQEGQIVRDIRERNAVTVTDLLPYL